MAIAAKPYHPAETEARWQERWEAAGIFRAQAPSDRPSFCIVIPPPNVTGSLHMGHAFEEALIDTLVRYRRMKGDNTLWLPGTDHASIAVSTLLDKQLQAEKTTRQALGREKYLERAWQWKQESGVTIVNQLRRLGVSADWSRERFTLDEGLSAAVTEAFVRLHQDGLMYRGEYLVNWCPASQSAVSDLEVDMQEVKGHLWHFRYPLSTGEGFLIVATTRPETLLGDTAVAVNPEDERYRHLIGQTVKLPLTNREIPIVADGYVDREFGSGCVKITPAHDFNDCEVAKRHHLPFINILEKDGRLNENGGAFAGMDRFAARKGVVAALEAQGLLEKIEDYTHSVPYSERGKVPIEPFLSTQWYVRIRPLADFALQRLDEHNEPRILPERWRKVYRDWLVKLEDWCISRQLWWGHQIPAWYVAKDVSEIQTDTPYVVARSEAEAYAQARAQYGPEVSLVRDPDVLDTWFSSGLWPFSTLGWPEKTPDFTTFYPTSTLITGFDIIFFWVARMTMMGGYFTGQIPFRDVYIHGLVRDENNQKMSKSKNNGIDPLVLIEKYGTDALRYLLVKETIGVGQDIRMDFNRKTQESPSVEAARNFANKLWNATRFVMLNLPAVPPPITTAEITAPVDRWIWSRYHRTIAEVDERLTQYGFGEGARALYEFIWGDYCDYYIELAKPRLQTGDATVGRVLYTVLEGTLRLLHPFMPHVTEELWQEIHGEPWQGGTFLATQPYPAAETQALSDELEQQFAQAIALIRAIRNLRAETEIKPGQTVAAWLQATADDRPWLTACQPYIAHLGKLQPLEIVETLPPDLGQVAVAVSGTVQAVIPLSGLVDLDKLRLKLEKQQQKLAANIARLQAQLTNAGYLAKAAPEAIAASRAELAEAEAQLSILETRLGQWG
ncbi:MAG: valine--tRNA ligase [Pseudanabaenaceae cyanobacterium]